MDKNELFFKRIEVAVSVLGLAGLALGGALTYMTYRQSAELQGMRALNEARMETCKSLAGFAAKLYSDENPAELRKTYYAFDEIKHGKGLILLDKDVIDHAVKVHNAAVEALKVEEGDEFRSRTRCALGDAPLLLALSCRRMMSEALRVEAKLPIQPIQAEYVMRWNLAGHCGVSSTGR